NCATAPFHRNRAGEVGPTPTDSRLAFVLWAHAAADVDAVPTHPARRPGRRRGPQPPAAPAGRISAPRRLRRVRVPAVGHAGAGTDRGGGTGGDDRDRRPGGAAADPAADRALPDLRSAGGVR